MKMLQPALALPSSAPARAPEEPGRSAGGAPSAAAPPAKPPPKGAKPGRLARERRKAAARDPTRPRTQYSSLSRYEHTSYFRLKNLEKQGNIGPMEREELKTLSDRVEKEVCGSAAAASSKESSIFQSKWCYIKTGALVHWGTGRWTGGGGARARWGDGEGLLKTVLGGGGGAAEMASQRDRG